MSKASEIVAKDKEIENIPVLLIVDICIMRTQFTFLLAIGAALLACSTASAQLTWDPDTDLANNGGAGTWDTSNTGLWESGGSNVDWTNGSDAIFGNSGGSYQVDLTSGGVTVGDLTYGGGGTLEFRGSSASGSPGDTITINSGGATWNTGGGEIEFFNDGNNNNTRLAVTSGDTLTVAGGGTFDTGQNPQNNANGTWQVSGATLDVTDATTVRGDSITAGAFGTVKLAGGSRYIHERNVDRTYSNNWELGAGTVTFDNRWGRNYTLSGAISGAGGMKVEFMGNRQVVLANNANSFTGGIEVSTASRLLVNNASRLGDAANNITLSGGGILRLQGVNLGSTRDIILSGAGGSIVNDSAVSEFGGKITGDGNLQIGNAGLNTLSNRLRLTGSTSDYTGTTTIHNGSIELGTNNALPSGTVLNIGGNNTAARLYMEGFDLEVAGLQHVGGNTREVVSTVAGSVLTLNVGAGESYSWSSNFNGGQAIDIVKTGDGTQTIARTGGYTTALGDVTVNGGELVWENTVGSTIGGTVTVGENGTLSGTGVLGGAVTVSGLLNPGNSPGTLTFDETLTLLSTATTALELTGLGAGEFDILLNDGGDILTAGGILSLDTTGYTAAEGDSFLVFENWGSFSGSFASINGTDLGGGLAFDTSTLLTNGTLTVVAAVPEPSSFAVLGAMGLLVLRRRRA